MANQTGKHTAWFVDQYGNVDLGGGFRIVPAHLGKTREERIAHANLIAAAPKTASERDRLREVNGDLLAALKQARTDMQTLAQMAQDERNHAEIELRASEYYAQLEPAIAKAEGRMLRCLTCANEWSAVTEDGAECCPSCGTTKVEPTGEPGTCILTDKPGGNSDDCTTHDHEAEGRSVSQ